MKNKKLVNLIIIALIIALIITAVIIKNTQANSSKSDINSFVEKCRDLEFYNTGVNLKYGDKLITLSTCEYSQKNGRMVIVAKKI